MKPTKSEVRVLAALVDSVATARVLNLARYNALHGATTPPDRRMFRNPRLERAIYVKHLLKPGERDLFLTSKRVATKILIPLDPEDLSTGAMAIFVNQKGYDEALTQTLVIDVNPEDGVRDRQVLAALDQLPSLDPFLTRELLNAKGFGVHADYFALAQNDVERMLDFVRKDIVPLIRLCFGQAEPGLAEKLSQKILASEIDASMEPLRATLRMDPAQFVEGIFCWKGFLYYKWVLSEVADNAMDTVRAIAQVEPVGEMNFQDEINIPRMKGRIQDAVENACYDARGTLATYDRAFSKLTTQADPVGFRDFLLAAPSMFRDVGEKIAAIQHVISIWEARKFVKDNKMPVAMLTDMLQDFEGCFPPPPKSAQSRAASQSVSV